MVFGICEHCNKKMHPIKDDYIYRAFHTRCEKHYDRYEIELRENRIKERQERDYNIHVRKIPISEIINEVKVTKLY